MNAKLIPPPPPFFSKDMLKVAHFVLLSIGVCVRVYFVNRKNRSGGKKDKRLKVACWVCNECRNEWLPVHPVVDGLSVECVQWRNPFVPAMASLVFVCAKRTGVVYVQYITHTKTRSCVGAWIVTKTEASLRQCAVLLGFVTNGEVRVLM